MSRRRAKRREKCLALRDAESHNTPLTQSLQKGDVLAYRLRRGGCVLKRLVNNVICRFTDTEYFHVEVYIDEGWSITSAPRGVCYSDTINSESNIAVLRKKGGLTEAQAATIEASCISKIGQPYGFFETLLLPVAPLRRIKIWSHNLFYNCTELTIGSYREACIPLIDSSRPLAASSPKGVVCSKELEFVGSWNKGHPNSEPLHDKMKYLKRTWLIARVLACILGLLSRRNEYFRKVCDNDPYPEGGHG